MKPKLQRRRQTKRQASWVGYSLRVALHVSKKDLFNLGLFFNRRTGHLLKNHSFLGTWSIKTLARRKAPSEIDDH